MKLYAQLLNEETKEYKVINQELARQEGWKICDLEVGYDGKFYASGNAPAEPEKSYREKRQVAYPSLSDQLDMIYWDKVNDTNLWQEKIAEIKLKYPKE